MKRLLAIGAPALFIACQAQAPATFGEIDLEGSGAWIAIATSEFGATGSLAFANTATLASVSNFATLHHDTVLRAHGASLYVIAREGEDGDNIRRIDLENGGETRWQYSVGRGSNPWDLLVLDDGTGLVARYASGDLVRVDLDAQTPGDFVIGEPIAISAADESDGRAEPAGLLADADRVYVIVQGLDEYPWCSAGAQARIVALDRESLEPDPDWGLGGSLALRMCNPGAWAFDGAGRLLIGFAGNSRVLGEQLGHPAGDDDGGIELVDLTEGRSLGQIASEAVFGSRDLIDLAVDDAGGVWVALADATFEVSVHRWSPVSGAGEALGAAVWTAEGVFDLETVGAQLWVADRTPHADGVVVIDTTDGSWIAGPIDVGHAPFDLEPLGRGVIGP